MAATEERVEMLEVALVKTLNLLHGAEIIDEFDRDDILKPLGLSPLDDSVEKLRSRFPAN